MNRSIKHRLVPAALFAAALAAPLAAQDPGPRYKRDLPTQLVAKAKVSEADAAKAAQAKYPNARIQAVELENESGRLIYSYELKVTGHSGIEEVNVNANTGEVVNTEHEGPDAEAKEAMQEKTARKHAGGEAGEQGEKGEDGGN
ncbi:MAG TPA: PepSY domain-containing protein [Gemmatimonadaceae bacterium]